MPEVISTLGYDALFYGPPATKKPPADSQLSLNQQKPVARAEY